MKTEILYGFHPVLETLRAGRRQVMEIRIARSRSADRMAEVIETAEARNIHVKTVPAESLNAHAGSPLHQGVAARVSPYPFAGVEELFPADGPPFLLLLDSIVDPHNLGALIRTALGVGVDGVIIPADRTATPTPGAAKSSAGALEHIRLARVTNLARTMQELKEKGVWLWGLDRDASGTIFEGDLRGSLGLVIGGEEKGIRPLVKKQCDMLAAIPQKGAVQSLNASAAGAVVLYEAFRQRNFTPQA